MMMHSFAVVVGPSLESLTYYNLLRLKIVQQGTAVLFSGIVVSCGVSCEVVKWHVISNLEAI